VESFQRRLTTTENTSGGGWKGVRGARDSYLVLRLHCNEKISEYFPVSSECRRRSNNPELRTD